MSRLGITVCPSCETNGIFSNRRVLRRVTKSGSVLISPRMGPTMDCKLPEWPPPRCRRTRQVLLLLVFSRLLLDVPFDIGCLGARIKSAFRPWCGTSGRAHCVGSYAANPDLASRNVLCDFCNWCNRKALGSLRCHGQPRPRWNQRK